jgi:signal peptidase
MRRLPGSLALLALLALGLIMLVPPLLGYQRYVIEGGSMGHAVPRGSIAYEEVVPATEIRVGDVITYRPPGAERLVTHRVAWIGPGRVFRTKGDVNATSDPWTFRLAQRDQARVVFHLPLAGYALAALEIRALRMAVIGGPALAIAAFTLSGFVPRRRHKAHSFG